MNQITKHGAGKGALSFTAAAKVMNTVGASCSLALLKVDSARDGCCSSSRSRAAGGAPLSHRRSQPITQRQQLHLPPPTRFLKQNYICFPQPRCTPVSWSTCKEEDRHSIPQGNAEVEKPGAGCTPWREGSLTGCCPAPQAGR